MPEERFTGVREISWLSLGSLGCNFRCPGCQNWELAHADLDRNFKYTRYVSPEELVALAVRQALNLG
jgi:pyruvate formate lyase activating enzyme